MAFPAFASVAGDFVKSKHVTLTELVSKAKTKEDEKKLDAAFDGVFDYDGLAKATLKGNWDNRSADERTQFSAVLKDLVRNSYRRNIKKTLGYEVEYLGEQEIDLAEDGKATVVRTKAKSKTNSREEPVSIDYVVHQVNGNWEIYDIVTEGSSLIRNYRNQFRRVIEKKGFDELLKRMKAKRDKGGDV